MDTRIAGIPCIINVVSFDPGYPARLNGHPDMSEPGQYPEIEFEVLDRNGRYAPWLERKMTDADEQRILEELTR